MIGLLFFLALAAMAPALPLGNVSSDFITGENPCSVGEWIKKNATPKQGGVGEAVVGTGDYIFIARCHTRGSCNFWQYSPDTDAWFDKKVPNQSFKNGAALAWDSKNYIYALLGAAYGDVNRSFFYRYNITDNSWKPLNSTFHPQGAGDAITWCNYDNHSYIYAMMGKSTEKYGGIHYGYLNRYNPDNDTWDKLNFTQNWTCTDDGASLVWTGKKYLYALQGEIDEDNGSKNNNFSRYDIVNNRWDDMADIPEGSCGVGDGGSLLWIGNSGGYYTNYIFALGGGCANEEPGYNFYAYNISNNSWESLPQIPCPVGEWVGNRLGFANGHIYYWQGTPKNESKWKGDGTAFFMFEFESSPPPIFDTDPGTYPSIFGTHNGTITPNQTMKVSKLYTYPCVGTGGHTEYARIWNSTLEEIARWNGYKGDWHNISFNETFTLVANETYNYTIKTGSYPQIHHTPALPTANGWINCTEFIDANGKICYDGIPAIKLYF